MASALEQQPAVTAEEAALPLTLIGAPRLEPYDLLVLRSLHHLQTSLIHHLFARDNQVGQQ